MLRPSVFGSPRNQRFLGSKESDVKCGFHLVAKIHPFAKKVFKNVNAFLEKGENYETAKLLQSKS